jgi:hypothetical protein
MRPTAPPLSPVPQIGAPPATANPALQGQQEAAPTEIDPEISVKTAEESVEATKTGTPEAKKEMNAAIEDMHGKGSLEKAYNEALERIGGERTFDPKLKREDWGLFLMDFGMRLAAASGAWNSQLGGAMGEAGGAALQGMQGRQLAEQQRTVDYNEQQRKEALDFAKADVTNEAALSDPDNIMWTTEGGMNVRTGQPLMEPGTDTRAMPGMTPGYGARGFSGEQERAALIRAGYSPEEAAEIRAGGLTNSEIREAARKAWTTASDKGDTVASPITGDLKRPKHFTKKERELWRQEYFDEVKGVAGSAGARPALEGGPRAQNTGGALPSQQRPEGWDDY